MPHIKIIDKTPLSESLKKHVCQVIKDIGFYGTPEDYVLMYYGKSFNDLTVCEAEMIVSVLSNKKGILSTQR